MTEEKIIIENLLDKFSKSKAFVTGEERKRAVILKFDSVNFPQYDYEDYDTKEKYYVAVKNLEQQNLIFVKYRKGVFHFIEEVRLNVDNVEKAYEFIGQEPLIDKIEKIKLRLIKSISICTIDWLKSFFNFELQKLNKRNKLVGILKKDINHIENIFIALDYLSQTINNPVTQRFFSIKCYHDSKYFEKVVQNDVVQIIRNSEPIIRELLETDEEISDRMALAQVGIILRPEVFEVCGNINIETQSGLCNLGVLKKGACIRSETVSEVLNISFDKGINCIIFIENKTNYDEYILRHKRDNELVVFHGGFYSPQKAAFFQLIKRYLPNNIRCLFWADIDYGGFRMFAHLKAIFENLLPWQMDECAYLKYCKYGLERNEKYFENLSKLLSEKDYAIFYGVINEILNNKKTIEQEIMLNI